jgi:hypothetical protein
VLSLGYGEDCLWSWWSLDEADAPAAALSLDPPLLLFPNILDIFFSSFPPASSVPNYQSYFPTKNRLVPRRLLVQNQARRWTTSPLPPCYEIVDTSLCFLFSCCFVLYNPSTTPSTQHDENFFKPVQDDVEKTVGCMSQKLFGGQQ